MKMNHSVKLFLVAMVVLATAFAIITVNESESDDAATVTLNASDIYINGASAYASGTVIHITNDERTVGGEVYEYYGFPNNVTVPGTTTIEVYLQETGDMVDSVSVSFPSSSGTNYTVTLKASNTSYGSVNPSKVLVARGTTYSTNGSLITFSDGQTARAESTPDTGGYNYRFTSWNSNSGTITANKTITANFTREAKSFTVTFDATTNGGTLSGSSTKTVYYNSMYGTLPTATKSGYTFKGWYTAASGGNKITSTSTVVITSNQTLYAQFTENPHTMYAYVADSDWGTVYIQNVTRGTTSSTGTSVSLSAYNGDVVRFYATANSGYYFWYWWDATSEVDAGSSNPYQTTVTGDLDLSANFSGNSYTVTFDATTNGGTLSGSSTKTVTHGSTYGTLPTATKTGFTFNGWYTAATGGTQITSSSTVTITSNQTLYAQFSPGTITIEASVPHGTGGTVYIQDVTSGTSTQSGVSVSLVVTVGHMVKVFATPTSGYSFDYWWDATSEVDAGSSNPYVINNVVYAIDLVANFTAATYTVTFDATTNGGTLSGASSKTVTYGSTYGTLPTATKTAYTFNGWYTAATGGTQITSSSTVTITSNQTLYAQFSPGTITIEAYVPESAKGTVYIEDVTAGTSTQPGTSARLVITAGHLIKVYATPNTGYDFWYWWDAVSETEVGDDSPYVINNAVSDVDLAANFTAATYTVTFDATTNGGTLSGASSKTVTYGSTYGTLPSATKFGYDFTGWYTAATGGTKIIESTTVTITADQTLYAQFIQNSRTAYIYRPINGTMTFNGSAIDFSTSPVEYTLAENTQFTLVATPASGYVFNEWAVHYQESEDFYYSENPTLTWTLDGDVDITASFVASTYTVTFDATTNGGTLVGDETKTVSYGSQYGTLPSATKAGFTFTGWYTAATGGDLITSSSTVTIADNHTLYAQFAVNTYDVTIYRPINGTITFNGTPIVFTTSHITYTLPESSTFTLYAYEDDGYRFKEWAVHYQESEDFYYSENPTLTWTVDGYVDITATFEEYNVPDVWWSNDYVNGVVSIAFDFVTTTNNYTHEMRIPLVIYDGIEDDADGIKYFSDSGYMLSINVTYDGNIACDLTGHGQTISNSFKSGSWVQFTLDVDAQKGTVTFNGTRSLGWNANRDFTFLNYETVFTQKIFDFSSEVTGLAISKIYHEDTGNGMNHPRFQVSATTTFLDTYGFVMIDPTLNIYSQFPNYDNLRLNLYSFAVYGETMTVNGHQFTLQGSRLSDLYYTVYTDDDDNEHYVIANASTEGAVKYDATLSNIYITWTNITSQTAEDRQCYLTFADDKKTIEMGSYPLNDLMISFTGIWYFTTALYEPYTAHETVYSMDWGSWFNLSGDAFLLVIAALLIVLTVAFSMIWKPSIIDYAVIIGSGLISYILIGGL